MEAVESGRIMTTVGIVGGPGHESTVDVELLNIADTTDLHVRTIVRRLRETT